MSLFKGVTKRHRSLHLDFAVRLFFESLHAEILEILGERVVLCLSGFGVDLKYQYTTLHIHSNEKDKQSIGTR